MILRSESLHQSMYVGRYLYKSCFIIFENIETVLASVSEPRMGFIPKNSQTKKSHATVPFICRY